VVELSDVFDRGQNAWGVSLGSEIR